MKPSQANTATLGAAPRGAWGLPYLQLSTGSIEALKWLGLVLMTGDHVNKYLLHAAVIPLFCAGRLVMPIFAIVLGFNLARPGTLARGAYGRAIKHMAITAAIASIPFVALGGLGWGWWPLNIMASFALAAASMYLLERGGTGRVIAAVVLLVVGGLFVEYWWAGLGIAMAAWSYARRPNWLALLLAALAFAGLHLVNSNWWALAALPVVVSASAVDLRVPRVRWLFYAYYPAHLAAISALRAVMAR
jgi:hypothetical protein